MPKVSADHLADRRDHILQAAIRCFARTSFHTTSMADIIQESGLSAGSVYRYFPSKRALIGSIIDHFADHVSAQFSRIGQQAQTPGDLMLQAMQAARLPQEGASELTRLLPQIWSEVLRDPAVGEQMQGHYRQLLTHLEQLAQGLQARGALDPSLSPSGAARVMLAVIQGYSLQAILLGPLADPDAYRTATLALFSSGVPS